MNKTINTVAAGWTEVACCSAKYQILKYCWRSDIGKRLESWVLCNLGNFWWLSDYGGFRGLNLASNYHLVDSVGPLSKVLKPQSLCSIVTLAVPNRWPIAALWPDFDQLVGHRCLLGLLLSSFSCPITQVWWCESLQSWQNVLEPWLGEALKVRRRSCDDGHWAIF